MGKSILLSIIAGLLLALGWPTYGFAGLLFIAFLPLLIIEKQFSEAPFKRKSLRIFLLAFLSFLIWNALTYTWLANAKPQFNPTDAEIQQAWFAYLFAVILNAFFMAIVFLLYHFVRNKQGDLIGFIFLPCIWMAFEKMHLNWDFSWPWLNLGNGFASFYKWVQWYEITGSFGGTLWVWVANLFVFKALLNYLEHGSRKRMIQNLGTFALVVLVPIGLSYILYYTYEDQGNEIMVAVVQPELNPYTEKYEKSSEEIVNELLHIGETVGLEDVDLFITPETSFPGLGQVVWNSKTTDPNILQIREWLQQYPNLIFIGGTDIVQFTESTKAPNITSIEVQPNVWANRYNSTIQLENHSNEISRHDKSKLVVGVEYFPYPNILKPLLGGIMLDFGGSTNSLTKSNDHQVFSNDKNDIKAASLVCYESIYGEFTSDFVKNGANLLTISTNDSWWGNTEGHKQLLAYAQLRAIENRRSIARSANSGISAFINQKGDIVESIPYGMQGAAKHRLKLNTEITNYTYAGDLIARIALLLSGILLAYYLAEKVFEKRKKTP